MRADRRSVAKSGASGGPAAFRANGKAIPFASQCHDRRSDSRSTYRAARAASEYHPLLAWYDKAVDRLTAVLAAQPGLATARAFLRNSYEGRYQALRLVGRTDEALLDADRCLALCEGAPGALVRLARFEVLIGVDNERAMAELDRVTGEPTTPDATLYHGVVVLCQAATAAEHAPARNKYCKRAMALLEQLLQRGYLRPAASRERLRNEPAFGVLREQDEFWDLLDRAEK